MGRVMKFRAWDIDNERFFDPDEHCGDGAGLTFDGEVSICYESYFGVLADPNHKRFVIQQYTGLQDKNGVDIYEGDILKCDEWYFDWKEEEWKLTRRGEGVIGHIWWMDGNDHWIVSFNHLYSECACKFADCRNVEIIGNMHENPELIKQ